MVAVTVHSDLGSQENKICHCLHFPPFYLPWSGDARASWVAQWSRIHLWCRRCRRCHGFDLWVGKIPWRRAWQPTPVFSPWRIPWTEEPDRWQSTGSHRVRHDWVTENSRTKRYLETISVDQHFPLLESLEGFAQHYSGVFKRDLLLGHFISHQKRSPASCLRWHATDGWYWGGFGTLRTLLFRSQSHVWLSNFSL